MLRKFLLSVAVILLLSSGVFADIGQTQSFEIAAPNKVKVVGGFGMASGRNYLEIGQRKMEHQACLGSAAMKQGGIFTQRARAQARSGAVGVVQNASVNGSQNQFIGRGYRGSHTQGQSLNLNFNTIARKPFGGVGRAMGSQSFVGEQSLKQTYRGGSSEGSQFIHAEQDVKIKGGPSSNVVVNNTLDVKMNQGNTSP
ncbi:MAG TPA: hypothetical protein VMW72_03035 [Sedimentisphaerales bacterium]|nr:hypothetical protein [Sedimentisphaerales bacterium]